jgi:PAS domain S-box-containing protein
MNVVTWIKAIEDEILERCQSIIRNQGLDDLIEAPDQDIHALCSVFLEAIEKQQAEISPELEAWAKRYWEEKGASLADLLKVSFAMRTAVREMILQSTDAVQANTTWQALSPIFDQIVELLSDIYTQSMEQTLTARLQESERLTSSLIQASEEADKALVQLHSIYDISQALGASLSDTSEIFDKFAQKLGVTLESSHCTIWLSDVGPPHAVATYVSDGGEIGELPDDVQESAFGQVLFSGQPQVLTRADDIPPADRALLDSLNAHSLLLAPFSVQEIPIGIVTVGRGKGDVVFDLTEVTLVESVVTQAAIAVQNAGLYEEIRDLNRSLEARVASRTRDLAREKERMETLYAIGQELGTSLDLDQVLEKTLQRITQAVNAKQGAIMMLDPEKAVLHYAARLTEGSPSANGNSPAFRANIGIPGWVIKHQEAVLIQDVTEDDRWQRVDEDDPVAGSLIAAPLIVGDDIHGVLQVSDTDKNAFDQDQQRLIVASALQIAQAMHNAKLYSREQKERTQTQAVLQSIADGVIVNDTRDRVIVFNAAAEEILDTKQTAVLGQDVWRLFDVFDENGRSDALAAMEAISSSPLSSVGQAIETTIEIQSKVISAHMTPVVTPDDTALGVVTALRDITREVEADRAKSEFVSTVSHELRTPLTSIKGYTDLIYAGAVGPVNDQQKRFLSIIKSNADRLTALINDLLDISRIESGRVKIKVEPQNLIEIVDEVVESLREQIEGKGIRLELKLPDVVPDIMGDRVRLNQIVTNLIGNAHKYTDDGWVRVTLSLLEGAIRLDVADSGIGISMEDQGKIFEKFYRADTPVMEGRGGTGLGLAITKELVELHGGRMWVKSELGVGSTFTVVLPAAAQDLPPSVVAELPAGAKKILVVDDERDILALLRHQLAMQGYQVITAATGGKAITKAIEEQPDLITLDILLPDRHGFDVLRELKTRPETANIPVIVLSVVQDETSGYRLGAVDYIVKPLDEQRLLGSVSYILNRKGKVLIAEDTQDTAELLTELLTKHGYEALHATNGYETLAMARREHPDLILLDLRMPGMDGYEALTRLKKDTETRNIPILVMSAHAADPVQERLRLQAMGAADFVSKPFSLEELIEEVERTAFGDSAQGALAKEANGSTDTDR